MGAPAHIATREELIACFRRIDRRDVELGDDLRFPLRLGRVVTWTYGSRAFLVLRDPDTGARLGVVFRRTAVAGAPVASMCAWCHRVRTRAEVQLLSIRITARRTIGQYLCSDLSCFSAGEASAFEPSDAALVRIERAVGRMHELVDQRLRGE